MGAANAGVSNGASAAARLTRIRTAGDESREGGAGGHAEGGPQAAFSREWRVGTLLLGAFHWSLGARRLRGGGLCLGCGRGLRRLSARTGGHPRSDGDGLPRLTGLVGQFG